MRSDLSWPRRRTGCEVVTRFGNFEATRASANFLSFRVKIPAKETEGVAAGEGYG